MKSAQVVEEPAGALFQQAGTSTYEDDVLPAEEASCAESGACGGCSASAAAPVITIMPAGVPAAEDEQLVRLCLQGDQRAWEELIDKYKRLIFSIPFKYGAAPEDASDIFQAVCIELFSSLSKLRNIQSLRAWLVTVTIHQSLYWKKKRGHVVELDAMEPEMVEEIAVAPEIIEAIQQEDAMHEALSQVPPRCARLLRLLFMEQPPLPYNEVAKRLGLATGSIGFIRGRCLNKLRKVLMELGYR
jgi:RNA polymerase sigma factor (sigma-70 family)